MRTIERDIVGGFIFSSDGKLLLGHNRDGGVYQGQWVVPGGGVDDGETKEQALAREMLEETGINISGARIKQISGASNGEGEKTLRGTGERVIVKMTFYNYRIDLPTSSDKTEFQANDDFIDAKWLDTNHLKDLDLSPPTIATLTEMGYLV